MTFWKRKQKVEAEPSFKLVCGVPLHKYGGECHNPSCHSPDMYGGPCQEPPGHGPHTGLFDNIIGTELNMKVQP